MRGSIVQAAVQGQVKKTLRHMDKTRKVSQRATVTALNKTGKKLMVPAKREIAQKTKLRAKDVTKRLRLRKATKRRPRAALGMLMRPIPWIQLGARELGGKKKKRGVRAGKYVDRDAFIASRPDQRNNPQVFKREGAPRLPVEVLKVELEDNAHQVLRRAVRGSTPIFRRFYSEQMQRWTKRKGK